MPPISIEVCVKTRADVPSIRESVATFFRATGSVGEEAKPVLLKHLSDEFASVKAVRIDTAGESVPVTDAQDIPVYCYRNSRETDVDEVCEGGDGDGMDTAFCSVLPLPNTATEGLWESIILEDESTKRHLLQYAKVLAKLSRHDVDQTIVSFNRLILLHGPPGTGKTTLSKGLAQKLAIQMQGQFPSAELVQVNAHSLFSRWFSESGKQVQQLFTRIRDIASDPRHLVFVLIDEAESLASARNAALSGSEPSDSIRAVNAMLTQIDAMRSFKNVIVFATSNIIDALDDAFLDRADMKIHLGELGGHAASRVLRTTVEELIEKGIVIGSSAESEDEFSSLAAEAKGLSGRFLRKLPVAALAMAEQIPIDQAEFMKLLQQAMRAEIAQRGKRE